MNKSLPILMTLVAVLAGCNKPADEAAPRVVTRSGESATGGEVASSGKSIAFVTNQIADFWKISEVGCQDAAKEFGVNVQVRMPPQATAVEQKRVVEDLLTSGVSALAISPIDADNQVDWLNQIAAKIPLLTHDSDAPSSNRLLYIGMDNYAAGRQCGELIKKAIPDGGEVMLFIGRLEQDNAKYRRQGVIDVLMDRDRDLAYYRSNTNGFDPVDQPIKNDKYNVLGTVLDQGEPSIAQTKAEDTLNSYPELDVMVGLFEYNPPACYQAIDKAGKLGQVKLVGFDENTVTLQAVKDGTCTGTVVQNPYMYGYESVRILNSILNGDDSVIPASKYVDIPPRSITQENVDEYWAKLKEMTGK